MKGKIAWIVETNGQSDEIYYEEPSGWSHSIEVSPGEYEPAKVRKVVIFEVED